MVEARELRAAATDYTEAEYQLSKLANRPIPLDKDLRALFFAEIERCEDRVRARSSCKDLDEGVSITGATTASKQIDLTTTQAKTKKSSGPSVAVPSVAGQYDGGVHIRGPLLPTGHLRKLVRRQGTDAEPGFEKFHTQLDRLTELLKSHLDITKELPEAPDDIMEMLVEQAMGIEKLHEKLCTVGRMLGAQDGTPESNEDEEAIEGEPIEEDEFVEEGLIEEDSSQYEDVWDHGM